MSRQLLAVAASVVALLGIAACGGGSGSSEVVASVGPTPITKATLNHWMTVLRGGRAASSKDLAGRHEALKLLIASHWLIGEAAAQGIAIAQSEVDQQVDRIENAGFPGGAAELAEFLKATGQTVADIDLRARAQLAGMKLRQQALASVVPVTAAQVAAYYAAHKLDYRIAERREARFKNTKSRAIADHVKREVETGKRKNLTSSGQVQAGELFTSARVPGGDLYEKAIDSAKPHTVAGPYKLQNDYWLYEVVKIIPARQRTLAEVSGLIQHKLTAERQSAAVAALTGRLKDDWTQKTDCKSGYVVQKCKQHSGPEADEELLTVQ